MVLTEKWFDASVNSDDVVIAAASGTKYFRAEREACWAAERTGFVGIRYKVYFWCVAGGGKWGRGCGCGSSGGRQRLLGRGIRGGLLTSLESLASFDRT